MTELSVRDLQEQDILLIDGYWQSLSDDDLKRMGIDRALLPSSSDFRLRLTRLLDTPLAERVSDPLIWQVDGRAIGFTNLNGIERGKQAEIHLHLVVPELRGKGYGRKLFLMAVQQYFRRHQLAKIVCQPASTNPAPNGLMRAIGIPVHRTYRTTPSVICYEHEVNRYEIAPANCQSQS